MGYSTRVTVVRKFDEETLRVNVMICDH